MNKKWHALLFPPLHSDHWLSIERYTRELSQALIQQESVFDIRVFQFSEKKREEQNNPFVRRRILYPLKARNQCADIFHVMDQSYANLVHVLPQKKTVLSCHDLEFWRKSNFLNWPIRKYILSGLQKAQVIACSSASVQKELLNLCPQVEKQCQVVPDSIAGHFKPMEEHLRKKFRLDNKLDKKIILLHVGTCQLSRKNIEFVFEIVKELMNAKIQVHFIQIGGLFTDAQKKIISNLGIGDSVQQIPQAMEQTLLEWYQNADFCLMPSTYEGFGLPVIESMACATSVLFSDIPVFQEIAGYIEKPLALDKSLWVKRILELSENKELKLSLIEKGLRHAQKFQYHYSAELFLRIYESLI